MYSFSVSTGLEVRLGEVGVPGVARLLRGVLLNWWPEGRLRWFEEVLRWLGLGGSAGFSPAAVSPGLPIERSFTSEVVGGGTGAAAGGGGWTGSLQVLGGSELTLGLAPLS